MMKERFFRQSYGDRWEMRGWFFAAIMAISIAVVVTAALIGSIKWDTARCKQAGERLGVPSRYRVLTNCFVLIDGKWVPFDGYRGTEDVKR